MKGCERDEKHEKKITGYALRRLKCGMVSRCSGGEIIKCAWLRQLSYKTSSLLRIIEVTLIMIKISKC